jgi:hypothetical protein
MNLQVPPTVYLFLPRKYIEYWRKGGKKRKTNKLMQKLKRERRNKEKIKRNVRKI